MPISRKHPSGTACVAWSGAFRGLWPAHGRAVLLVLAVTGMLLGLVGMHQMAAPPMASGPGMAIGHSAPGPLPGSGVELGPTPPAMGSGAHGAVQNPPPGQPSAPSGGHDSALLHMCLAVLIAVAVFGLSVLLVRWWRDHVTATVPAQVSRAGPAPRAPPPTAPARLALLCVLRT